MMIVRHGAEIPPGIDLTANIMSLAGTLEVVAEQVAPPLLPEAPDDDSDVEIEFEANTPFPDRLIEEVDINACYGTDTNLLTMDLLRKETAEEKPPVTGQPGFWKTKRTRK